jgi:hypothetical protein
MKIVALEEYFATAEVIQGCKSVDPRWGDLALKPSTEGEGARIRGTMRSGASNQKPGGVTP